MKIKNVLMYPKFPIVLALFGLFIGACGEKIPPEESVKQRAMARWAIRVTGKIDGLYEYLSPSQRQVLGRVAYERTFGGAVKYLGAEVKSVSCEGEKSNDYAVCHVKIYIKFETRGANTTKAGTLLEETWIKEDNQWWLALK